MNHRRRRLRRLIAHAIRHTRQLHGRIQRGMWHEHFRQQRKPLKRKLRRIGGRGAKRAERDTLGITERL